MFFLLASILSLFVGPAIYRLVPTRHYWLHIVDGFVFVTIGGIVVLAILPEAVAWGGPMALVFAGLGLMLPTFSERFFQRFEHQAHAAALMLGLIGLLIHSITDGTVLAPGSHHHHEHASNPLLLWGVLLHRFPVGLTVWWFLRPVYGARLALSALALMTVGTLSGYFFGSHLVETLSSQGMAWFQAFVAGSLVHVVLHRPHGEGADCHEPHRTNWFEGIGNVSGAAILIYLGFHHGHADTPAWMLASVDTFVTLALESAPALLLAYLLAGLASVLLPQTAVNWMGRGNTFMRSARGVLIGLPLPVCSCGVVPIYHTLVKRGASSTAAMAFLIATPELGLDAVLLSLPLLGGTMTLVRVSAAALVAVVVGIVVGRFARRHHAPAHDDDDSDWTERLRTGFLHSVRELVDHTGPWILVGLAVAGALDPAIRSVGLDWLPRHWEIPLLALLGLPVYVCASGATPFVAILLVGGVSPGAALAFLLTGPATNITTFGVLSGLHGRRVALLFGALTFAASVALGFATNWLLPNFTPLAVTTHDGGATWLQYACAFALLVIYVESVMRRGARTFIGELASQGHDAGHDHDHHHAHNHA